MKMKKKEDELIKSLTKKKCVINTSEKTILFDEKALHSGNHRLGNGTWGKIDALCTYFGYAFSPRSM